MLRAGSDVVLCPKSEKGEKKPLVEAKLFGKIFQTLRDVPLEGDVRIRFSNLIGLPSIVIKEIKEIQRAPGLAHAQFIFKNGLPSFLRGSEFNIIFPGTLFQNTRNKLFYLPCLISGCCFKKDGEAVFSGGLIPICLELIDPRFSNLLTACFV